MVAEPRFVLFLRVLVLVFFADAFNVWRNYGKTCKQLALQKEPDTTYLNGATRGAMLLDSSGSGEPPPLGGLQGRVALAVEAENLVNLVVWHDMADHAILAIDSTSCVGDAMEVANSLYHFLVQTVDGRALQLIHLVQRGNGLEAWRVLCREYQPAASGRFAIMLRNILNPKSWQSSVDFRESLISWDNLVLEFEQQSTEKISETLKIAIILEHAPYAHRRKPSP